MTKQKRIVWHVLGRAIGTATGWDQCDTFVMQLYDFEPAEGVDLPAGVLTIDFETGKAQTYNDAGQVEKTCDIVAAISNLPITYNGE